MQSIAMAEHSHKILIRIDQMARLFNSLDPTPFRERDLDEDAERFIVEWAEEANKNRPIEIIVELPQDEACLSVAEVVQEAIRYNFESRGRRAHHELRQLLSEGRRASFIGIPILGFSLIASQFLANLPELGAFSRAASESLVIFGWVANWRPLEIFLYEWWPIVRREKLYRRLAAANVRVHFV